MVLRSRRTVGPKKLPRGSGAAVCSFLAALLLTASPLLSVTETPKGRTSAQSTTVELSSPQASPEPSSPSHAPQAAPSTSPSQADTSSLVIRRLSAPVTLDGPSDEEAWRDIPPLPMVMMVPNFGGPPSERTEVRLGYDENFLFVSGRLYMSDVSKIRCPSKKRDYFEANTDWFGILLDTFNDNENALAFWTTPTGLRWDGAVYGDAVQTRPDMIPINVSWNAFWDVAVIQTDAGWFVEMRIPFSSLRFQDRDGRVVMGLTAFRYIACTSELATSPAIEPKWGQWGPWKPSRARDIVLENVRARRPLYIVPYFLGGAGHTTELNDEETAYITDRSPKIEGGLDVKYGLTSNLTADLTLNTDFAQVEADDEVVNLTRFSLFFPEKRLFFQERSSAFSFPMGGQTNLFYSRRIGLYEERTVRLYGGARVVGRLGRWDLGFLDMQTAPLPEEDLASENFGVLRMRRQVINPNSYVGGIVTSRLGTDGSYNTAYGLDGIFRVSEADYLSLAWAQTFMNGRTNEPLSLAPARSYLSWERRTTKGFGIRLATAHTGKDFDPGIGFLERENITSLRADLLYGWIPGEKSRLQSHYVTANGYVVLRNEDNALESAQWGPGWTFSSKSGWLGTLSLNIYRERVWEEFSFEEGADVIPGNYTFYGLESLVNTPGGGKLSAYFVADAGSFYDGHRLSLAARPIWGISSDLSLTAYYQFNWIDFSKHGQELAMHIARLQALATLSTKFSASAFVQYNSAAHVVIMNARIRYNPREGNDIYLVYNDTLNGDRFREVPHLPVSSGRAVMLKLSYTFNIE